MHWRNWGLIGNNGPSTLLLRVGPSGKASPSAKRRCEMTIARTARSVLPTKGVVFMHCCPSAIAPHVEWALAGVLGQPARLSWSGQPAAPTHLRSELQWAGP